MSTAEATPGTIGRGEQGEARRAQSTPNGGPHLELGQLRLKTWSKSDFSISQTTGQHIHLCCTAHKKLLSNQIDNWNHLYLSYLQEIP